MIDKEILGGVSPLKARQSSRGGKNASKATATSKRRGGFAKSTGKRGAGGRNVGGYNANTSFVAKNKWTPPASGGTAIIPNKPYSYDADGNMQVDPSLSGTEHRTLPGKKANVSGGTYDEVWDANKDNFQEKWESKEKWIEQAKKEKKEGYYVGEGTDPKDQYRTWKQKNKDSEKTFSEWQDLVKNK